jgi:hypothetical protein
MFSALANLARSAAHYAGYEFRVLGLGAAFTHTGVKTELFHAALQELLHGDGDGDGDDDDDDGGDAQRDRLVMVLDAYDVLLNAPAAAVAEAFRAFRSPIVYGAERGCWPYKYCTHMASVEYPERGELKRRGVFYPYLNSGVGVGYAWALERAFSSLLAHPVFEEQDAVTRLYLEEQRGITFNPLIALDTRAVISQQLTLLREGELRFDRAAVGRWANVVTGSRPLVLHGNGLDGIARLLALVRNSPAPSDWPPFYVNHSGWAKSNASKWSNGAPGVGEAGPFLSETPERFDPTWLPAVDRLSYWYNQGSMAMRAGRFDLALPSIHRAYTLFLDEHEQLDAPQRQGILKALNAVRDKFVELEQKSQQGRREEEEEEGGGGGGGGGGAVSTTTTDPGEHTEL